MAEHSVVDKSTLTRGAASHEVDAFEPIWLRNVPEWIVAWLAIRMTSPRRS